MTPDHAVIEFVHRQRVVVGGVMLALAVACLAAAGYCGYRGLKDALDKPSSDPTAEVKPPDPAAGPVELEPVPYRVGLGVALVAALGLGGVGAFFVAAVPDPNADRRRTTDRILLFVAGYVFGLANRACGLFLFAYWFAKLYEWVKGLPGSHKTGWWPVAALLQFLLGAGVTFLAAQPARADERNRPWVRRAVYAVNLALSGLLLVVGLVLVNAVVAMKLPAKLDTTSTGFYSLTAETKKFTEGLKVPVKAYLLTTDLRGHPYEKIQDDATRLLAACQRANPTRFEVKVLSSTANAGEINDLKGKYKAADLDDLGVLLTTGDDPDRFVMVSLGKMGTRRRTDTQEEQKFVFVGEAQLVGGMMALTEERTTVYYTRGSGELALSPPTDPAAAALARPAYRLQDVLTAFQCDARPLVIDPFAADPKVPDDAGMVVVLDPLTPLPPATATAIQQYMATPRAGGRRGKLLVFAGAHNVPAGNTVAKTGLEPVLAPLGIEVADKAIYNQPVAQGATADMILVGVGAAAVKQRHPIALAAQNGLLVRGVRPLRVVPGGGRGPSAQPFMGVASDGYTWLEAGVIDSPRQALADMANATRANDRPYMEARQLSQAARTVGAVAADADGKPVAAVFGFADGLSDDASAADGGQTAGVFKACVGWLRERPPAPDITPKEYAEYTPKKGVSGNALLTLPLAGTLLAVVLLGLGVWAVRRK